MNMELKIEKVKNILKDEKVIIGFSGGADSTLIAYLSSKVAKDTLAVTIDNHLFPTGFIEHAREVCSEFGINHEVVDINFYKDPDFLKNDSARCYNCRSMMYDEIIRLAWERDFDFICDGNNISDLIGDRPGILITYSKGFRTPLIDARLTSKEIHEYLKRNNIPYSRSTTCLATRIPTNTPTTVEKVERISHCEDYILSHTDCEIVKVRDNYPVSIVEVDDITEILKDNAFKRIDDELKRQGFVKVALDLSQIDDDEDIELECEEGSFRYQLPYAINLKKTKPELKNKIINENKDKIELENITIQENGLIIGKDYKTYEDAKYDFMEILSKIRRNIGE